MSQSYSVNAVLSAKTQGFTSGMKAAQRSAESLGGKLKSGLGMGAFMAIGQKAVGKVSGAISGMMGELSASSATWKTFKGTMKNFGMADQITTVQKKLQNFAEATIYSSSDMAQTYSQLAAVGIKSADQLVTGFGGLASAAENPAQAMKSLSQQATQMAAQPKVKWQDFKIMLEQSPAGMAAVAKEMGKTTGGLIKDIQAGTVKTNDFFKAVQKVGNSKGWQKQATEYKTVGQALDGLQETAANKLLPAYEKLSGYGIKAVEGISDAVGKIDTKKLSAFVDSAAGMFQTMAGGFKQYVVPVLTEAGRAAVSVGKGIAKAFQGGDMKGLGDSLKAGLGGLKTVFQWIADHGEMIGQLVPKIAALALAFKAFKIVQSLCGPLATFAGSIVKMAMGGIEALVAKLFGVAAGEEAVGAASASSATQTLQMAAAFLALGAGVALICAGFLMLASAATQVATAGPLAVAVLAGLVVGVGALMAVAGSVGPMLTASAVGLLAFGAAILMASAGMAIMANAAAKLGAAGPVAVAGLAVMIVGIGALMVVAAAVGPVLTVCSVGLIAFGAAVALAGLGINLACQGISAVLQALLPVVNAVFAGIVAVINAASSAIQGVLTALSTAFTALGNAIRNILNGVSGVITSVGNAIKGIFDGIAKVFISMGKAAKNAGSGAKAMASGIKQLVHLPLADLAATMVVTARGMKKIASAGSGMADAGKGTASMARALGNMARKANQAQTSLRSLAAAMRSISSAAKSAGTQVGTGFANGVKNGMNKAKTAVKSGASSMKSGFNSAKTAAKSAASSIKASMDSVASKASSAGSKAGHKFASGLKSGLKGAKTAAKSAANAVVSALKGAASKCSGVGSNAGSAFAAAMESCATRSERAASRIVAAAEKAAKAKAKIKSPSRVWMGIGRYMGLGLVIGLEGQEGAAEKQGAGLAEAADRGIVKAAQIGSPSKKAKKRGKQIAKGFEIGLNISTAVKKVDAAIVALFGHIDKKTKKWVNSGEVWKIMSGVVKKNKKGEITNLYSQSFSGAASKALKVIKSKFGDKVSKAVDNVNKQVDKKISALNKTITKNTTASTKSYNTQISDAKKHNKKVKAYTAARKKIYKKYANKRGKLNKDGRKKLKKLNKKYDKKDRKGIVSDKTIKSYKKRRDAIKATAKATKKLNTAAGKGIKDKFKKSLNAQYSKLYSTAEKTLNKLADKYQKKYNAIIEHKNTFVEKMRDYGQLFTSDSYGFTWLTDFKALTAQQNRLKKYLQKVQKAGVSQNFLNQITQMDVDSQETLLKKLLTMSNKEIKKYSQSFDKYWSNAESVGKSIYAPYIKELDAAYNKEVKPVINKLGKDMDKIGKNVVNGMLKGIKDKKTLKTLKSTAKSLSQIVIDQVKKTFKIKSPSKVMAGLGRYVGEGFAGGIKEMAADVERAMNQMCMIPAAEAPALGGSVSRSLSSDYNYNQTAEYTVVVPVELDGREVARVTAPYTLAETNKLQHRENRRKGRR